MQFSDALGKPHTCHDAQAQGAPRIVSLVPSLTELLIDLGLGEALVGRTGFCIHPRELVRHIPKLGGTKGFDLERLRALAPTHVLVNIDENRREEVEALYDFVPHVVVTHPLEPRDNLALYRLIGGIFNRQAAAEALCARFEAEWAALQCATARLPRQPVLYLIWQAPWMSVSRDTYISRMLAAAGWDTEPVESSTRYPEIALETLAPEADIVFLSTEPFPFRERDVEALAGDPALARSRVKLIDGEMLSWYGSRAPHGLAYLRQLRLDMEASRERPSPFLHL